MFFCITSSWYLRFSLDTLSNCWVGGRLLRDKTEGLEVPLITDCTDPLMRVCACVALMRHGAAWWSPRDTPGDKWHSGRGSRTNCKPLAGGIHLAGENRNEGEAFLPSRASQKRSRCPRRTRWGARGGAASLPGGCPDMRVSWSSAPRRLGWSYITHS